jgi:hypothetical protein
MEACISGFVVVWRVWLLRGWRGVGGASSRSVRVSRGILGMLMVIGRGMRGRSIVGVTGRRLRIVRGVRRGG